MLTTADKEEIRRLVGEMIAESGPVGRIVNEGFPELTFINPETGGRRILTSLELETILDITARAIEVFGTRERALRWLRSPVQSLSDRTPISLLNSPEGIASVKDTLGRIEHGVW